MSQDRLIGDRLFKNIFIMIPADDNIIFFLDLAFTYKSFTVAVLRRVERDRDGPFHPFRADTRDQ
jgi:hypothetical protein